VKLTQFQFSNRFRVRPNVSSRFDSKNVFCGLAFHPNRAIKSVTECATF